MKKKKRKKNSNIREINGEFFFFVFFKRLGFITKKTHKFWDYIIGLNQRRVVKRRILECQECHSSRRVWLII